MTGESGEPPVKAFGADDLDLQAGQQVGEYVVEKKIGEGGFGTVFKADHPLIGKLVAIKVLNRQFSAQAEMVSRFVAEARAVNQIRHRHIIDIFSFGQLEDGRHYYIMEFLEGQPLDEYLDERAQLSLGEAIPILRAVARALDAAHAKGIAHRDLKPENVFLVAEPDGTIFPKLLDFGIAKLLSGDSPQSHKTRTGAPIGTPYYMSPEQCRGREVDHRTDIYAFGIVAYRMLTGALPFDGEDYMEILLAQIQQEPPLPSSCVPSLPASVDDGIAWMLKKDPGERPPNLVTAVRALEDAAIAAGIPVPAGPAPSGVYAASTGSAMSQPTPSRVTPMPASDSAVGVDVATAPTMGADGWSAELNAVKSGPNKGRLLGGALLAAVAVGVAVFFVLGGGSSGDDSGKDNADKTPIAATQPADAAPIPTPDPPVQPPGDPVPTPVPEPPARAELVTITITRAPEGTEVYLAGALIGVTPEIQLERSDDALLLTFKADGYKPKTRKVRPVEDKSIRVKLKKKRVRGGKRPPRGGKNGRDGKDGKDGKDGRNELEDPFKK